MDLLRQKLSQPLQGWMRWWVSFGFSTKEEYDAFKKPKYLKVEVIKVENVYGVDSYIPDFIPWTSE